MRSRLVHLNSVLHSFNGAFGDRADPGRTRRCTAGSAAARYGKAKAMMGRVNTAQSAAIVDAAALNQITGHLRCVGYGRMANRVVIVRGPWAAGSAGVLDAYQLPTPVGGAANDRVWRPGLKSTSTGHCDQSGVLGCGALRPLNPMLIRAPAGYGVAVASRKVERLRAHAYTGCSKNSAGTGG